MSLVLFIYFKQARLNYITYVTHEYRAKNTANFKELKMHSTTSISKFDYFKLRIRILFVEGDDVDVLKILDTSLF